MRAAALVALAGCGRVGFDARVDADAHADAHGDAHGDTAAPIDACAFGPFGSAQRIAELSSASDEFGPWMSADRLEILFTSTRDESGAQIFDARRTDPALPFDAPVALALGSGENDDAFVSDDGLRLYYSNYGIGEVQIHETTRSARDQPFAGGAIVDDLNTVGPSGAPSFTANDLEVVFSVAQTGSAANLYVARRSDRDAAFATPVALDAINTANSEQSSMVSADGGELVFATNRGGSLKLYRAAAAGDGFGAPTPFAPELLSLSTDADTDPFVSRDGKTLVFGSNRAGASGFDLFVAERDCP